MNDSTKPEILKHKDVLGQTIDIGCTVLYGSGSGRGNYAGFTPSVVIDATPKMIRITDKKRVTGTEYTKLVDPGHCVVIDKLLEEE